MSKLEKALEREFALVGVSPNDKNHLKTYLDAIKEKDMHTYEHSIRVGLLSSKIARHLDLDVKELFFAGLIHDFGKIKISDKILRKKDVLTEEEMEEVKKHPQYTYEFTKDKYAVPAEIALRHHRYQQDCYPKNLPEPGVSVGLYARILSLVDIYDALKTRVSYKQDNKKLSKEEVKSSLLKKKPDINRLIEYLYAEGIFGKEVKMKTGKSLSTVIGVLLMGASLAIGSYGYYKIVQDDLNIKYGDSMPFNGNGQDEQLKDMEKYYEQYLKERDELGEWYFDVQRQKKEGQELREKGFELNDNVWGYKRIRC